MSEKILIIPDVHEEIEKVRDILCKYKHIPNRIWLGDFFDSWSQPWQSFRDTVTLVQTLCEDERNTLILGNHDASYWWGGSFRCSGWMKEKAEYISKTINEEEWSRFKLYTWADKFLCSHAGLHPHFLPRMGENKQAYFSQRFLDKACQEAMQDAAQYKVNRLLGAGWYRGGNQSKGGLIWLDWDNEFEPIPGVNQIVGHTWQRDGQYKALSVPGSKNYCLDTGLRHVGIVEGDGLVVEEV